MISRAMVVSSRWTAILAAASLSACGWFSEKLPNRELATLAGGTAPNLRSCPTAKCLTIVLAPWCGVCHQVVPYVLDLRKHLETKGVTTRFVIALAPVEKLKPFAEAFGPDTQLDPSIVPSDPKAAFPDPDGIPMFVVSDQDGVVAKRINGFPSGPSTPEALAGELSLP